MSSYSQTVLEQIDYNKAQTIRQSNFSIYHQAFGSINKLELSSTELALKGKIPFCYPLWLDSPVDRTRLYERTIFIPTLWKDVLNRSQTGFELEKSLSEQLLCLPLDHRYSESDCHYIIETIQNLLTPTLNSSRHLRTC
jgi:dTDP-4-amino-4,6-dideoxygalactose transaminase